jgi:hypothetical protein
MRVLEGGMGTTRNNNTHNTTDETSVPTEEHTTPAGTEQPLVEPQTAAANIPGSHPVRPLVNDHVAPYGDGLFVGGVHLGVGEFVVAFRHGGESERGT